MAYEVLSEGKSSLRFYADAPQFNDKHCAAIGAFEFVTKAEGQALVARAVDQCRILGRDVLLGPMNGDTWHGYRLWLESDGSDAFLLEPTSGSFDLEVLENAGFEIVSRYFSSRAYLQSTLGAAPVRPKDIQISQWDGENGALLVDRIFELSKDSFAKNQFFKPISLDEFHQIYDPMLATLDPRLVFVAENAQGDFCGFLFGYADPLDASQKTVVLKTYASAVRGAGFALADAFHRAAIDLKFETVIHALMHESNASLERSKMHNAHIFRKYGLLAKRMD